MDNTQDPNRKAMSDFKSVAEEMTRVAAASAAECETGRKNALRLAQMLLDVGERNIETAAVMRSLSEGRLSSRGFVRTERPEVAPPRADLGEDRAELRGRARRRSEPASAVVGLTMKKNILLARPLSAAEWWPKKDDGWVSLGEDGWTEGYDERQAFDLRRVDLGENLLIFAVTRRRGLIRLHVLRCEKARPQRSESKKRAPQKR